MLARMLPATEAAPPPENAGITFCSAAMLTRDLPAHLLLDATGRPFSPVVLAVMDDLSQMPAQFDLLIRKEAVGGAEALLKQNGERIGDAAINRLHRRLAHSSDITPFSIFLESLHSELLHLDHLFSAQYEEVGYELRNCQQSLQTWQETTEQEPGLFQNMMGWIVGSTKRISLPQAIALWNRRESLHLSYHAVAAARAVVGRLNDEVEILRERQASLLQTIERNLVQAQQQQREHRAAAEAMSLYAPWTWQINPDSLSTQLMKRVATDRLVADLIAYISNNTHLDHLAEVAHTLAEREAARIIDNLSIAEAIMAEAGDLADPALDPLVLVGQALLSQLQEQSAWRLLRTAHPRVEIVQVTNDGQPLFHLDGLGSAAYGDAIQRMGFVQLESAISSADLRILQEGNEQFEQILNQRNLYVLEDLAQATWR
ncbi:hypothetical protein [Candidatus Oscillochloris fontis]|uniref:hypothetical protein n=1 Tax=Candidatus Oscillochloris fontis TaxID=2496868 RepID=UPI00101CC660|nr:hypothetical protein [Candidatus Oscillochloris fontis]